MLSSEASVPPFKPPRIEWQALMRTQRSPLSRFTASATSSAPMSDGTESKPQHGTMRVPLAAACSWWRSIISRTHGVSPVMSQ